MERSAGSGGRFESHKFDGIQLFCTSATDGTNQVGMGSGSGTGGNDHALVWSGTANSAVDLHPTLLSGFTNSWAVGTGAGQQVGYAYGPGTFNHAMLWTGTAVSAVDLTPTNLTGYTSTIAEATYGSQQVGGGGGTGTGGNSHAVVERHRQFSRRY